MNTQVQQDQQSEQPTLPGMVDVRELVEFHSRRDSVADCRLAIQVARLRRGRR